MFEKQVTDIKIEDNEVRGVYTKSGDFFKVQKVRRKILKKYFEKITLPVPIVALNSNNESWLA